MPTIYRPTVEVYEERYLLFHNVSLLSVFLSNPYVSPKNGYRSFRIIFLFPIEPRERVKPLWDHVGHYCVSQDIDIVANRLPVVRGDIATSLYNRFVVTAKSPIDQPPTLLNTDGVEIPIHDSFPTFQPGSIVDFLGGLYPVKTKDFRYCALSIVAMKFVAPGEKIIRVSRSPVQVAHEAFRISS